MAGGSLVLTVNSSRKMAALAQRLLCWVAAGNKDKIEVQMSPGGGMFGVRIAEENFGAGALVLKRGGTNLVAGYVAGTNVLVNVANGDGIGQDANTCPASTNQPTTTGTAVVTNVGGNPRAITLNYANVGGGGTVNIDWGDGTVTAGAAESGAAAHTFPDVGTWNITVTDASDATQVAAFSIVI